MALLVHRAKFRIGQSSDDFRRQIGGRNAQIAVEILQLIGRRNARNQMARGIANKNAMRIDLAGRRKLELHRTIQLLREQSDAEDTRQIRPPHP